MKDGIFDVKPTEYKKQVKAPADININEIVEQIGSHKPIWVVGLKDVVTFDPGKIELMTPADILFEIDLAVKTIEKFVQNKRIKFNPNKWKRMWADIEIEYGHWSNLINKNIRNKLAETTKRMTSEKNPKAKVMNLNLHNKYSWVNAYWWNRFHWIYKIVRSKSRLAGISSIKGIKQGKITLSDLINDKADPSQLHPQFIEVINNLKKITVDKEVKETLDNM